jgi:hypothetical protein
MTRLEWPGVLAWRLRRQQLDRRAPREAMLDVVNRIVGLHAQVMSSAELTLWARVDGLEPDDVQRALWEERTLVKTWAMRGTLHLLPAAELPLFVAAQGMLPARAARGSWLKAFGLTAEGADAILAAIPRALDGRALTREELATEVGRLTSPELGDKLRESWGALLKPSAFAGDVCFAPSAGQKVRFTHPAEWLGEWPAVEPAAGAAELTRRYLAAYGPATREEFARWFGSSSARAVREAHPRARRRGRAGRPRGRPRVDARRRRGRGGRGRAGGRRPPPARLRPLRRRRAARPRRGPARRPARPRLPPAGLAVAGAGG